MDTSLGTILKNPFLLFLTLGHRGFFKSFSDEKYLKIAYRIRMGKPLDLEDPKTFTEKIQWLKIHDRRPVYTQWVDKYEAKKLAADLIGEEYIIPTYGVWDHFDEIDFDKLPDRFVLKCTHDSGGLVVCKDKKSLDKDAARKRIEGCLKHNYYWGQRERQYKDIKPRVIAEKYMEDEKTHELRDYKFFTFDGTVKAMFIITDRGSSKETKSDFFDADGNHLPVTSGHPNADITPSLPVNFEKMKQLASKIGQGIPQVRVDFYEVNGKIYFGELTLAHWSGMTPFVPEEWDYTFGSWIDLNKVK